MVSWSFMVVSDLLWILMLVFWSSIKGKFMWKLGMSVGCSQGIKISPDNHSAAKGHSVRFANTGQPCVSSYSSQGRLCCLFCPSFSERQCRPGIKVKVLRSWTSLGMSSFSSVSWLNPLIFLCLSCFMDKMRIMVLPFLIEFLWILIEYIHKVSLRRSSQ